MLIDFTIKNFRSIKNPVSIDLNFSQNAPKNYALSDALFFSTINLKGKPFAKIIPILVIFGGNATGKSNLLKGVKNLKSILSKDVNFVETPFPFNPFLLSNTENDPTVYSIVLEKNSKIYKYVLALGRNKIHTEELYEIVYDSINKRATEKVIFNIVDKIYDIPVKHGSEINFPQIYETECNFMSTFLSKIAIKYSGVSEQINDVFNYMKNELEVYNGNLIHRSFAVDKAAQTEDIAATMKKISNLLSKMDIDIEEITCDRNYSQVDNIGDYNLSDHKGDVVSFRHTAEGKIDVRIDSFKSIHRKEDGRSIEFNFETQESLGTKTLFSLLGIVIDVLRKGKTLVIDEIDRSIHIDLLSLILKMFKSKNINKHGAQLVCTSHNPCILLSLNKSEAAFTDKEKGATKMTYLSDLDIKNENNFLKNYLAGRFGGKPITVSDIDLEDL